MKNDENVDNIIKSLEDRFKVIIPLLRKNANLIISTPIVLGPIIGGSIVLLLINSVMYRYVADIFDWWWIGDLSYYSISAIITSFILIMLSQVVFILFGLGTIYMAKKVIMNQDYSIQDSVEFVSNNLINLAVISFIGQFFILTYLLIPLGILILVVGVVNNGDLTRTIRDSIEFFRENPFDMIILSAAWLLSRVILVQVPSVLFIAMIPDLIIGFTVLDIYISK